MLDVIFETVAKTFMLDLVPVCTTHLCVAGSIAPMDMIPMSAHLKASAFPANFGGRGSWTVVPAVTGEEIQAVHLFQPPAVSNKII